MQLKKQHIRRARTFNDNPNSPLFAPFGIRRQPGDFNQLNNWHPVNRRSASPPKVVLTPRESLALNAARTIVVPPRQDGPLSAEARALNGKTPSRAEYNKANNPVLERPLGRNW